MESSTGWQSKQCAKHVQTVVYKLSLYENLFEFRSFTSTILNLGQVERSLLLQAVLAWVVRGPVSYIGLLVKFWTFLEVSTRSRSFYKISKFFVLLVAQGSKDVGCDHIMGTSGQSYRQERRALSQHWY